MAWSVVQSASAYYYGTAVTATFTTANVSSGNKIIVAAASSWSDAPSTVRDAALNNWTLVASKTRSGGSVWLYALDTPAGDVGAKPAITVTYPSNNGQTVVIQEVSGLLAGNTTAMIDTMTTAVGTLSGTTAATGSPTYSSTGAGEYLVCAYGSFLGDALPVKLDATWTLDPNSRADGSNASIEYKNSTGGAETSGFTGAYTSGWSILTVAFQLAGAAAVTGGAKLVVPQAVKRASLW